MSFKERFRSKIAQIGKQGDIEINSERKINNPSNSQLHSPVQKFKNQHKQPSKQFFPISKTKPIKKLEKVNSVESIPITPYTQRASNFTPIINKNTLNSKSRDTSIFTQNFSNKYSDHLNDIQARIFYFKQIEFQSKAGKKKIDKQNSLKFYSERFKKLEKNQLGASSEIFNKIFL